MRTWHPIASASDLPYRHVYHGQLHGRELAVWRADDGYVNVWENRCLHRGVRLSIAINDGRELQCQYHGWRYANRTSACTYIPAHPADAPARTICNRTFASVERYGMIWTTLAADQPLDIPSLDEIDGPAEPLLLLLRPLAVSVPARLLLVALDAAGFAIGDDLVATGDGATLFIQPVDAARCVARGLLADPGGDRPGALRSWHCRLTSVRAAAEADLGPLPVVTAEPEFAALPAELAELPRRVVTGRATRLRVRVARKWLTGTDIAAFELAPIEGVLPTAQPGAHVDLQLPIGDVRQYSVVSAPGDGDRYVIGVKRELQSRGGSICLHDAVRQGDVLAVSEPRNNFPLRRDADLTLLIAGGIGVTPLLSMAQSLHHQRLPFRLHYFGQSEAHLAFPERLAALGESVVRHCGLDPEATRARLVSLLDPNVPGAQVYVCGPGPMIEAVRSVAAAGGWPDSAVHFEYFKNSNEIDKASSFELALARSCLTVQVEPGETILEAIRGAGVELPSSCEQGACGTCVASVIEGTPVHQDVYLNATEKAAGQTIMTCVSRCSSPRLVLDV